MTDGYLPEGIALTSDELDELEALSDAASPGPWHSETWPDWRRWSKVTGRRLPPLKNAPHVEGLVHDADRDSVSNDDGVYGVFAAADADLIAAARNALPALLVELRALRAELADLKTDKKEPS